jgi:hypothetical protein
VKKDPKFVKKYIDDENVEYSLNGEVLITATHDQDGWSGMERIEKLFTSIAQVLDVEVLEADA